MTVARTALVVMERGGDWPARVHRGLDLVALQQENDERQDLFLRRTFDRVTAIEENGGRIYRAALSCNDDLSRATLENRALIARVLLAAVLRVDRGRLFLVGSAASASSLRHALLVLADTLTSALIGTSACVSARFVGGGKRVSRAAVSA